MEEQQAITPVFKSKVSPDPLRQGTAKPTAEVTINDVQVAVFKGAHPNLVSELVKVVVRYTR